MHCNKQYTCYWSDKTLRLEFWSVVHVLFDFQIGLILRDATGCLYAWEGWTWIRGCMDSWYFLTVESLLAYTDPNKPCILYTDAYDIACGGALDTVHLW